MRTALPVSPDFFSASSITALLSAADSPSQTNGCRSPGCVRSSASSISSLVSCRDGSYRLLVRVPGMRPTKKRAPPRTRRGSRKSRQRPTLPFPVPSALEGLASVFGMGTGVAPPQKPPGKPERRPVRARQNVRASGRPSFTHPKLCSRAPSPNGRTLRAETESVAIKSNGRLVPVS
jgi:hypothetical protein